MSDMLDMVAPLAERNEAEKRLDVGLIVVYPPLVAIELALGSTDAARLAVLRIHLFAECIPCHAPHRRTWVQVPEGLGNQFNAEFQYRRIL